VKKLCPEETEQARTARVDNQAGDKAPAVEAISQLKAKVRAEDGAVVEAGAAVADKDRAAAQAVVAVKIVSPR
jgi:hypothetical protein